MAPKKLTLDQAENLAELTVEDLKQLAADSDVEGRSKMSKDELVQALQHKRAEADARANPPQAPPAPPRAEDTFVPRAEYDRVLNENQQLRAQMQYQLQGAVGAPNPNSPDPGVPTERKNP